MKNEKLKKEEVWSTDGILIKDLKIKSSFVLSGGYIHQDYYTLNGKLKDSVGVCEDTGNHLVNVFQTKERAELERDRREVGYIMKKMACESREDNDWRVNGKKWDKFLYTINFRQNTLDENNDKFIICIAGNHCDFNTNYFATEQNAQKCLDFLLKKYGEQHLKKIWGIK